MFMFVCVCSINIVSSKSTSVKHHICFKITYINIYIRSLTHALITINICHGAKNFQLLYINSYSTFILKFSVGWMGVGGRVWVGGAWVQRVPSKLPHSDLVVAKLGRHIGRIRTHFRFAAAIVEGGATLGRTTVSRIRLTGRQSAAAAGSGGVRQHAVLGLRCGPVHGLHLLVCVRVDGSDTLNVIHSFFYGTIRDVRPADMSSKTHYFWLR